MTLNDLGDPSRYMDIGVTSHLASNSGILSSISNMSHYNSTFVGNDSSIPVTQIGHTTIPSYDCPFHLNHILVTPDIIKNLIFVRIFTTYNDTSIKFDPSGINVKELLTKQELLRCDSTDDLYPITPSAIAFITTASLWNQCLGHPGPRVLKSLIYSDFISRNKPSKTLLAMLVVTLGFESLCYLGLCPNHKLS